MAVVLDIIDGARGRFTLDGWELVRIATVTGVTGDGDVRLVNALNTTGIPLLNAEHPSVAGTYLREAVPEAIDDNTVKITLTYGTPNWEPHPQTFDTIEVGSALNQVETNLDAGGNTMWVEYTFSSDPDVETDANYRGKTFTQSGLVSLLIPQHDIVITRLEYANPSPKSKDYVGSVNNGPWSLDPSAAARTWLCTVLRGRSNDGGVTYLVTYAFQYRDDVWDSVIQYRDPRTGRPPKDVNDAAMPSYPDGQKTYQGYWMMNFDNLDLPG